MSTLLFYDIETSGLNKAYDQILQFAAIRTDLELNIIETHDILIQVSKDTLISPYALLVHQLSPNYCSSGISEYKAILAIHKLLNTPGTISLGYNTLGFDDEFLRFAFHKHLLSPYTHQYANNCFRADLYFTTVLYYLFANIDINWPIHNEQVSLKLENLNFANNFTTGRAHTALADVEATLGLAKKLYQNQQLWNFSFNCFNKHEDKNKIAKIKLGIYINGALGVKNKFSCPVMYIGRHNHYKNQTIWLNLNINLDMLQEMNITIINKYIIRKKDGEPGFIIPFNRAYKLWENSYIELINDKYNNYIQFINQLEQYYTNFEHDYIANCDPSANLYQTQFMDNVTTSQCNKFWLTSSWQQRLDICQTLPKHLQTLAKRILWRNDQYPIDTEIQNYIDKLIDNNNPLIDHQNKTFRTIESITKEITIINENATKSEQKLLEEYRLWLEKHWQL